MAYPGFTDEGWSEKAQDKKRRGSLVIISVVKRRSVRVGRNTATLVEPLSRVVGVFESRQLV
jgi:hypothetical protein